MKIELLLPQDGVDCTLQAFDANGKPITTKISKIQIEPYFFKADQRPNVLFGKVLAGTGEDDTDLLHRFVARVSGSTGKCQLEDRSGRVQSKIETKRQAARPPEPAVTAPAGVPENVADTDAVDTEDAYADDYDDDASYADEPLADALPETP